MNGSNHNTGDYSIKDEWPSFSVINQYFIHVFLIHPICSFVTSWTKRQLPILKQHEEKNSHWKEKLTGHVSFRGFWCYLHNRTPTTSHSSSYTKQAITFVENLPNWWVFYWLTYNNFKQSILQSSVILQVTWSFMVCESLWICFLVFFIRVWKKDHITFQLNS